MEKLLHDLLAEVKTIIDKNEVIRDEKKKRGDFFNIFNVLNVQTNEVRLHSAFIVELLNPKASHGLGDTFLAMFLKQLQFDSFQISDAIVVKEEYIGPINDSYTEGGRLDIIIQSADRKYAVVIENKIYAHDQHNQLLRYKNYVENTLKLDSEHYKILYLTLFGDEPSPDSTHDSDTGNRYWKSISYKEFMTQWLIRCMQIATGHPLVRETLNQYLELIKQLTNQTLEAEMEEELIELLMCGKNLEYAQAMAEKIDEVKNKIVEEKIIPVIKKLAVGENLEVEFNGNLAEKDSEFWFTKISWKEKNICISFLFENSNYRDFSCGIYRIEDRKWDKLLFDKLTRLEGNLWNNNNDECPYWAAVEDINYGGTIPVWCFTNTDLFIEKIRNSLFELTKAVDKII